MLDSSCHHVPRDFDRQNMLCWHTCDLRFTSTCSVAILLNHTSISQEFHRVIFVLKDKSKGASKHAHCQSSRHFKDHIKPPQVSVGPQPLSIRDFSNTCLQPQSTFYLRIPITYINNWEQRCCLLNKTLKNWSCVCSWLIFNSINNRLS